MNTYKPYLAEPNLAHLYFTHLTRFNLKTGALIASLRCGGKKNSKPSTELIRERVAEAN